MPVGVSLPAGGLAKGQALVYRVDGRVTGFSPTSRTSLVLSGLEPGRHTISVAVVADETTLVRSQRIGFGVVPPLNDSAGDTDIYLIPTDSHHHRPPGTDAGDNDETGGQNQPPEAGQTPGGDDGVPVTGRSAAEEALADIIDSDAPPVGLDAGQRQSTKR